MKQFKTKPRTVLAQQWFPGTKLEGVTGIELEDYGSIENYPHFHISEGVRPHTPSILFPGYLVVNDGAFLTVYSDNYFKEHFEEATD